MADFIPPSGPPPPKVPEGWKAQWNEQYKEWFYVNIHTKQSTWERPTSPAYPTPAGAPPGPPPSYPGAGNTTTGGSSTYPAGAGGNTYPPEKGLGSNNPYSGPQGAGSHQDLDEDARYAQKLQAEEDARARASGRPTSSEALDRGASDDYYQGGAQGGAYGQGQPQSYDQQQLPPRDAGKKGGIGGFLSKLGGGRHSQPQQSPYGQQGGYGQQQGYGQQAYGQQQGYGAPQYGGYPQQGYGGGYGGPPQGGYGGYQQQAPPKRHGLGAGGGAALGLGGGLLGGMMLGEAMDGGDGGGDGGGGDDGGGGGDDGGGGGDF